MEKAKKNYSKEKAAEYYLLNKEAIKKRHKNVTDEEKQAKNECQKNYFKKLKTYKVIYCWKSKKRYIKWPITTRKKNKCKNMSKMKIRKV